MSSTTIKCSKVIQNFGRRTILPFFFVEGTNHLTMSSSYAEGHKLINIVRSNGLS